MNNLHNYVEDTNVAVALTDGQGTADRTGSAVDCGGSNNVAFLVQLHSVAGGAVASASLEHADSAAGPWTAVANSTLSYGVGAAGWLMIELRNPAKLYNRLSISKDGSNATQESALALLGNSKTYPVQHPGNTTLWLSGV